MELTLWLADISYWYQSHKHDQGDALRSVLFSAPPAVFGPHLSDEQSKAIACWLDGCLRLFQASRSTHPERALGYLLYISSKLEQVASDINTDIEIRDWCVKRLQHLTVLSLEFCNQQEGEQWLMQANEIIECHVKLLNAIYWNESRKHDQVKWH